MSDALPQVVGVRIELDRRISYALQQNDVPVVKAIRLDNLTSEPIRDVHVRVAAEPDFSQPWSTHVALVAGGATYRLDAIDLQLSPRFLGELTERLRGQLLVEVARQGTLLARHVVPIELLARDEWGGLSSLPEILASFVLPNHPVVGEVLASAAWILGDWTGIPSLSGYQTKDARRVHVTTAAIYSALQERGLTYVNPPASFEAEGQRVRLPDRVIETGMGTCLDLALLAAGCLEQVGLHALIVLVEGHALTGVWLEEDCFPEAHVADPLRLRKRIDLLEIVAFDPTCLTSRPAASFEHAVAEAKAQLLDATRFQCAIDIRRARKGRIRPLPVSFERVRRALGDYDREPPTDPAVPVGPPEPIAPPEPPPPAPETPATRLDRWQRKLLDLTLRNRLLNFRETKKTLSLLCPDLAKLEDMLADGETFQIHARPTDLDGHDPRDSAAHRRRTGREARDELWLEELAAKRLRADTTKDDLERRLVEIYRAARLGLEEGGASALYLAIGFLAWYETETSERRHFAPILLLPLELHRGSIQQGFTLKLGDDDPRVNVTLLELLRQDHGLDIPALDPPPEDENGLDVARILHTVRHAVRDIDRWDVLDEVRIGIFSFAKFLMWRDLRERADDLMRSPVVAHLVTRPGLPFDPDASFPRPERLDDERGPKETYCPLPADSSQLAAVFAAAEGRSFVLEGPPGTGKSQTITNLIAHCLAEGKRVLFVSEKMAALNVVHTRLDRIGLARYCLELHSNKSHKREVVAQLGESLRRLEGHDPTEWAREADRLSSLRRELNAYVRALHQQWPNGDTVFRATSRLIGLRDVPRVPLRWDAPDALDSEQLHALRDLVDRLATAGKACGEVSGHAWSGVQREEWTPGWEEDLGEAIGALSETTPSVAERSRETAERLLLEPTGLSLDDLGRMDKIAGVLMESPAPPVMLIVERDWEAIRTDIGTWIEHGPARDAVREELRQTFHDGITALNLDGLQQQLDRGQASRWPLSWWRIRPVRKALAGVAKDGKVPPAGDLAAALSRAVRLRSEQQFLDRASDRACALLGRYWRDTEADWTEVEAVRDWAQELRRLAGEAAGAAMERLAALRAAWAKLATEGCEQVATGGVIGRQFMAFRNALEGFLEARRRVVDLATLDVAAVWGSAASPDAIGRVQTSVRRWRDARGLRDWCAWRRARREAMRQNLGPQVDAYESGTFRSEQLRPVFERSYAQWWLNAATERDPILSGFSSPEHERKIRQFRAVDDRYMKLTESLVQARLGERVPESSLTNLPNSEVGILLRELGKRRGHMSVRQLIQRIPNLLPRLKPCLLMSPMSVAQFLDPAYPHFDIVVFDEASQIPVWDAVGAIARGRQAVIVGDPKQLPPTSFFQRQDDEEEMTEDQAVEDLESILDECMGANIPWRQLDWHYRSRHESLIAFSNHHYYDNRLLTFPSPALIGMGVLWRHVPGGVYDKGKSRTNRSEADAVVAEVLQRLRNPRSAGMSIGIVTFSLAQQTLIEDLLDAARLADAGLDRHFAEEAREPVFVKNLENVQGDERDVILFSICYGPDAHGKVSMNFGPMNRDGGERRLNVAVTRARREVVVFSTLRADQIDLARTRARGVRDLKHFLEYAEGGPSAILRTVHAESDADFESPFEEAVHRALVERGWQVHTQVGSARYRIDLAIVDPKAPGRYLLGVECDGANYHRAKTARDRDKLREAVLRNLGWQLHRIWSTDWWTDPAREVQKLDAAIDAVRKGRPSRS
ncbi:MAG: DUF4011 domain-containing protein [Vicinamibacterales bacterium]